VAAIDQLTATDPSIDWDPLVPLDDPYPVYRQLRDEAPVYHHPGRDLWVLSRFDDIVTASKDWETFSSSAGGTGNDVDDTYQLFLPAGDLPANDPPVHTRLRGALRLAFSPSALKVRFEPAVRAKVHELIDSFIDAREADFAYDLARPLPATTMFTSSCCDSTSSCSWPTASGGRSNQLRPKASSPSSRRTNLTMPVRPPGSRSCTLTTE